MFSQTTEYALRAVVFLADNVAGARTTQEIAAATKVPRDYLSKVLRELGRAGIVTAQRGKNGGFCLAHAPEQLTILDVVDAVDPLQRIRTCPLGLRTHQTRLCRLHRRLDDAMQHVENELRAATVAEMMQPEGPGSSVRPLCEIGEAAHA